MVGGTLGLATPAVAGLTANAGVSGGGATAAAAVTKLRLGVVEAEQVKDAGSQVILDSDAVFKYKAAQSPDPSR